MSTYAEQPFTEFEERYFLAEILKKSSLPPSALLVIIRDSGIDPAWNDIALPNGRSVSACQQAYQALWVRSALAPPPQPPLPPQLQAAAVDPGRRLKRPFSSLGDATTILPRELQPRPPTFASVNGQTMAAPPPAVMSPVEPQRKKRGRPTKSEWERRQAEARERGEVWPKPRKPKARPSMESAESSKAGTAGSPSAAGTEDQAGASLTRSPEMAQSGATYALTARATVSSPSRVSAEGAGQSIGHPSLEERRISDGPPPDTQMADYQGSERPLESTRQYRQNPQGSTGPQISPLQQLHQLPRESGSSESAVPSQHQSYESSRMGEAQQGAQQGPLPVQGSQVYQGQQPPQAQQGQQGMQGQPGQQR